jgi:hypothetical protein
MLGDCSAAGSRQVATRSGFGWVPACRFRRVTALLDAGNFLLDAARRMRHKKTSGTTALTTRRREIKNQMRPPASMAWRFTRRQPVETHARRSVQ